MGDWKEELHKLKSSGQLHFPARQKQAPEQPVQKTAEQKPRVTLIPEPRGKGSAKVGMSPSKSGRRFCVKFPPLSPPPVLFSLNGNGTNRSTTGSKLPSGVSRSAEEHLVDASPLATRFTPSDPSRIRIRYTLADSIAQSDWDAAGRRFDLDTDLSRGKAACVLGLDFGTAYTKACVRFRGTAVYVVSWKDVVQSDSEFLLPGTLSILPNSRCVLGYEESAATCVALKMKLLETNSREAQINVVAFLALVTRYVRGWLFSRHSGVFRGFALDWFINIGLPSVPWESAVLEEMYRVLAAAAWDLSASDEPVTLEAAERARDRAENQASSGCSIKEKIAAFPEFVAEIAGYVRSPRRNGDLHALIDVGAGTVDIVTFNVAYKNDEDLFPIFKAEVKKFGTHFLLASRAEALHMLDREWHESDAGLSTSQFARRFGGSEGKLWGLSHAYTEELARTLELVFRKTKADKYPQSPAWRTGVPTFFCGGGRDIDVYQRALAGAGFCLHEINLPIPEGMQSRNITIHNFHRVAVAYGLSFFAESLGTICRSSTVRNVPPLRESEICDRFVTKDQV